MEGREMSEKGRNDVWLGLDAAGAKESHFRLAEFGGRGGVCMVNRELLAALEALRFALGVELGREVAVRITHCLRWGDFAGDPDAVADSMHLAKYGGIAADVLAYDVATGARVSQVLVAAVAARIFDFVKGDYADYHVHCDMRSVVGR